MSDQEKQQKLKTQAVLRPVMNSYRVDVGDNYAASRLGDILLKRANANKAATITLTKQDVDYVRGLSDGGCLYANWLLDALHKADKVEVSFDEVPER